MLRDRFDVVELDLTHTLMDALHDTAATVGVPWSDVLGADADGPGSRAHQGLRALAQRSLPAVHRVGDVKGWCQVGTGDPAAGALKAAIGNQGTAVPLSTTGVRPEACHSDNAQTAVTTTTNTAKASNPALRKG